jgi:xyloglucan-specific exo-beta-1,4-glucanase
LFAGGGGFIPGIVFNTGTQGVAYARADVGGAYRLNADDTWTPLTDWANNTNWYSLPNRIGYWQVLTV